MSNFGTHTTGPVIRNPMKISVDKTLNIIKILYAHGSLMTQKKKKNVTATFSPSKSADQKYKL